MIIEVVLLEFGRPKVEMSNVGLVTYPLMSTTEP
jgi:hypothetical protein